MKIEIVLTKKEKENCTKICSMINPELDPLKNKQGKWGFVKDKDIFVEEKCVLDATNLIMALLPKFISLFQFISGLFELVKEAEVAFINTWVSTPTVTELPKEQEVQEVKEEEKVPVVNDKPAPSNNTNNKNNQPNNKKTLENNNNKSK